MLITLLHDECDTSCSSGTAALDAGYDSDDVRASHQLASDANVAFTGTAQALLCCAGRTVHVCCQGNVFVNQYLIIKELGRGAHGSVKLVFDTEQQVVHAMKVRYQSNHQCECRDIVNQGLCVYRQVCETA
jgi:hypothetical protein